MFAATGTKITKRLSVLACVAIATAALAGCSGSDGSAGAPGAQGPAGPAGPSGPQGPTGSVTALDITTARLIKGTITGVSGTASQPTVAFKLEDEFGTPLKGLQSSTIRFTIAKLQPGANGGSSQWVSYVNRNEAATQATNPVTSWGTAARRQATAEAANATGAVFTDNGNGTYSFKFSKDLGAYTVVDNPGPGPAIAFDGSLTTRVGFEIRGTGLNAINNPVYTYVPATGAVTSLPLQRDIVNTAECSACHDKLAFHGGPRTDVQYCVTCHNPGTIDAQSGNSVDMKVMVHKIHMGTKLPTVVAAGNTTPAAGKGYTIWGNSLSYWNFSEIAFTQDVRNCTTCHRESDTSTPQASNWRTTVNSEACGTCHDDVNFTTGVGHGGIGATDADCATCHGPNATVSNGALRTENAHKQPLVEAAKKFEFKILSVALQDVSGTKYPVVTFSITDPTNANAPYDLSDGSVASNPWVGTEAAGKVCRPGGPSRLAIDIGWNTADYTNFGANAFGQPVSLNPLIVAGCTSAPTIPPANLVKNANGSYTLTSPVALPSAGVGTVAVALEGHPAVDVNADGVTDRIAVDNVVSYLKVNDATAVARRGTVDIKKCNDCHNSLSLHGNNRTDNPQVCVVCHNPSATDGSRRPKSGGLLVAGADGLLEQSIDMKWMIHAIHAGEERHAAGKPTIIYGFGGSVNDFGEVAYPGDLANCEGCHLAGKYAPVDATAVQGTTFSTDPGNLGSAGFLSQADDRAASPNAAACGACHFNAIAIEHMKQNGGAPGTLVGSNPSETLYWLKDANGKSVPNSTETCALCHGTGRSEDVKAVHGVGDFKFN